MGAEVVKRIKMGCGDLRVRAVRVTPVVGDTSRATTHVPEVRPMRCREAVAGTLRKIDEADVETRWSGPLDRAGSVTPSDREGLVREVRSVRIAASPAAVYRVLASLGGDRGWLVWEGAWQLRGLLDRLAGGPRLRRGRRHPTELLVGEAVDF